MEAESVPVAVPVAVPEAMDVPVPVATAVPLPLGRVGLTMVPLAQACSGVGVSQGRAKRKVGQKKLTLENNKLDLDTVKGRRECVKDSKDQAGVILAELGRAARKGSILPDEDVTGNGEGGSDGTNVRVGPEGLVGDANIGGDELASGGKLTVAEDEGSGKVAVGGVDGAGGADEATIDTDVDLALGKVGGGQLAAQYADAEDVGIGGRGSCGHDGP